jgi:hypothetical protein
MNQETFAFELTDTEIWLIQEGLFNLRIEDLDPELVTDQTLELLHNTIDKMTSV